MEIVATAKEVEILDYSTVTKQGVSKSPPVKVPEGTKVQILSEQFSMADMLGLTSTWINVEVLDGKLKLTGPYSDKALTGWIPGTAFGDTFLRNFQMKNGLSGFSGNAYGHYLTTSSGDALQSGPSQKSPSVNTWLDLCPQCGCDWASHYLRETTSLSSVADSAGHRATVTNFHLHAWGKPDITRGRLAAIDSPRAVSTLHDAHILYDALRYVGRNKKDRGVGSLLTQQMRTKLNQIRSKDSSVSSKGGWAYQVSKMIGVLHVADSDRVYAGHSGVDRPGFKEVCEVLGFTHAPALASKLRIKSRSGADVQNPYKFSDNSDYRCAAPHLIQAAIHNGDWPYSMSEIWFDPRKSHKSFQDTHTIESCDRCRNSVAYMLCPDAPTLPTILLTTPAGDTSTLN